jgi:hypothetical protein
MAGKRQHYIPRFLLKGFCSKTEGTKSFIWYFRKGSKPSEISIRDVAVSRKFYGDTGPESIDEKLTKMERQFGPTIDRLRTDKTINISDLPIIVELFINMVIRTQYIRKSFTDATGGLMEMAARNLSDPHKMAIVLNEAIKQNKSRFHDQLRSSMRSKLATKMPVMEEHIIRWVEENAEQLTSLLAKPFSKGFVKALTAFIEKIDEHGTISHKDALDRFLDLQEPSKRHHQYSNLHWITKSYDPNQFILGDICVLTMDTKSQSFSPPIFSKKDNYILLLPISHDTLLIGSDSKEPLLPPPEVLNIYSVELSIDYFVSSIKSEREKLYSKRVGEKANSWWEPKIGKIEKKQFGE